jgi:hypothetical protein
MAAVPSDNIPKNLQVMRSNTGTLVIPNRVGHRRILREIFLDSVNWPPRDVEIKIGNVTMLSCRSNLLFTVFGITGNRFMNRGALGRLYDIIPNAPRFTAAEDEDITITTNPPIDWITVNYEDVTEGDVKDKTVDGGSQGKRHIYIMRLTHSQPLPATGRYLLDFVDLPPGLSFFTDTKTIAPNQRFTLYMLAVDAQTHSAGKVHTLHLFKDKVEMFTSETNQGLRIEPNEDPLDLPWYIDEGHFFGPDGGFVFEPNSRIEAYIDYTKTGSGDFPAKRAQLHLIGVREILEGAR